MSTAYYIGFSLNVKEESILGCVEENGSMVFTVELPRTATACLYCHKMTDQIKDYRWQQIAIGNILGRPAFVRLHKRRYVCPSCGRTFYEVVPFVMRYQRRSKNLQAQLMEACFKKRSFKDIAEEFHVSTPTLTRCFDQLHFPHPNHLPQVLAMDEFRGNAHGQKYQVAVTDVADKKLLDVLPRRDAESIIRYFTRFPREERKRVRYVVMDMSNLFRAIYKALFPAATLVVDRFHVQRLVLWAMERIRKDLQHQFPKTSPFLKRNRRILQKRGLKLRDYELVKLRYILAQSDELRHAYILKEEFYKVMGEKTEWGARKALERWLAMAAGYNLYSFRGVLKSFKDWKEAIIQAVIQPYSNGFTEGCNNLIKTIKRVAFGMRNFRRFRNRILYAALKKKSQATALPGS
jgi:transposase